MEQVGRNRRQCLRGANIREVLSAHLRHHVSVRYDRLKLREAVVEWVAAGGAAVLFEDEPAASAAAA